MDKIELLLHGWDSCYDKEDWYPPLSDALKGLTAEQANWRPDGEYVNTIWENVHHLIFYKERLLKRMTGEEADYPDLTNDDTFAVESTTSEAWEQTLSRLQAVHLGIRERLAQWGESDFEHVFPNRTQSAGRWVNSLILHDAYHTGQIMFIRKLQGSWPSRRSFD